MNIIKYLIASKIYFNLEKNMDEYYEAMKNRKDFNGIVTGYYMVKANKIDKDLLGLLNLMADSIDAKVEAYMCQDSMGGQTLIMYKITKEVSETLTKEVK